MQWISSAGEMRELDRSAIGERGIPSTQLMEAAARAVAEEAAALAGENRSAAVFCGSGNNGGDGVAAARFLRERGVSVRCFLVGRRDKLTDDTAEMERRLCAAGGALEDFDPSDPDQAAWVMGAGVLVDALFGIGLTRPVTGVFRAAIERMNASPAPTLAVDLPSGVETDTGAVLGAAAEAAATVTFTAAKPGHYLGEGGALCGRLSVVCIGIPEDLTAAVPKLVWAVGPGDLPLPRRRRDSHKGDYGRDYILAGSRGYTGAPVLAARGALRSGAGLVTLAVPEDIYPIVAVKCDEVMPKSLPADGEGGLSAGALAQVRSDLAGKSAVLVGPGLGRGAGAAALTAAVLEGAACPVVLDADGLNAVSGHIDRLDARAGTGRLTVLTPHDGEFARLAGGPPGADRLRAARDFAGAHGCILVLKGHRTITAFPDGRAFVNTTGNPGMAKGGSGDVLGGIIISLLGQGLTAREAIPMAVCLHGMAGDLCARELGEYGMTPSDMIERLPLVMKTFERRS